MTDNNHSIKKIGTTTSRELHMDDQKDNTQSHEDGPVDINTSGESYIDLNARISMPVDGKIMFDYDKQAARQFFLQHVNNNVTFFHDLEEKITYLTREGYYNKEVIDNYDFDFIKKLFKMAYAEKFRFQSFMGAYKFYGSYALKDRSGKRYLERYEDRVCMIALHLAQGDEQRAIDLMYDIISLRLQPATPIMLNAGLHNRGELVSCQLIRTEDSMDSIGSVINSSLQLSKQGGGVGILLTNLRESGAPIKELEGQASGVIPVMKILEGSFNYANQLGARDGAGAVYISVHHPDVFQVLDSKRENADEAIRIKNLSIGLVVTDKVFELAKKNKDYYLFSPYDVERVYGVPMSDISINEKYDEMVENPAIRKTKASARDLFTTIAELQFESGYPYLLFEDTANKWNPIKGRINMSNLCQPGDTRILTPGGYRTMYDLWLEGGKAVAGDSVSGDEIDLVADNRVLSGEVDTYGIKNVRSTRVVRTAEDAEVFEVLTSGGRSIRATAWHKFFVKRNNDLIEVELRDLKIGDQILTQSSAREDNQEMLNDPDLAFIAGVIAADGTFGKSRNGDYTPRIDLYGDKKEFMGEIKESVHRVIDNNIDALSDIHHSSNVTPDFCDSDSADRTTLSSALLGRILASHGFTKETKLEVPEFVWRGDSSTRWAYLDGIFRLDGGFVGSVKSGHMSAQLGSISQEFLREIQTLLIDLGVTSSIYPGRKEEQVTFLPDGQGGIKEYQTKPTWSLRTTGAISARILGSKVKWKETVAEKYRELSDGIGKGYSQKFTDVVVSVKFDGIEDVYDVEVPQGHSYIGDGVVLHNCSEITQVNSPATFSEGYGYAEDSTGKDISCNLASLNIKKSMDTSDLGDTVESAIRMLTSVSDQTSIDKVPTIKAGNDAYHSVGLGAMNLHGFLAGEDILYGSEEALDFVNVFFATVKYHALNTSADIAAEKGERFFEYELSEYHDPEGEQSPALNLYTDGTWLTTPQTEKVKSIFEKKGQWFPDIDDWKKLSKKIAQNGIYNAYLMAVAPNGSSSYQNYSTSSLHPVVKRIETRKESLGRIYVPAPGLTNENKMLYPDAYEVGPEKIIDTYAVAQKHIDQAMSCTLFFWNTDTTRDLNRAYIYAWSKGLRTNDEGNIALYDPKTSWKAGFIKTLYYSRIRSIDLAGTEIGDVEVLNYQECVDCMA